jgi:RNA polymerase sigma-70 factor, ECF subfamily
MEPAPGDITRLLAKLPTDPEVGTELMPLIYQDLRRIAGAQFSKEKRSPTIQLTEVVDEAFVRLIRPSKRPWKSRAHFFGSMAKAVRETLVDRARAKNAQKRPGKWQRVELRDSLAITKEDRTRILIVNETLDRLAQFAPRQSRIVELRFFAGMSIVETAEFLGVRPTTIKMDWHAASAWLRRELEGAL